MQIVKYLLLILLFSTPSLCKDLPYQSKRWKALLHFDGEFHIKDNNFYFSKKISLKNEFFATIKNFKQNPFLQCRFPARKLFIEYETNTTFEKVACPNFENYLSKAPAEKIFLVFASENVKNPTSMMGHTFFKISGKNGTKNVSHAITFYTVIDTTNPLLLIYKNLFTGMNGLFSLQPYQKVLHNYLYKEGRNVWEFELDLNQYEKDLIHYHFWELKDIKMSYFFTKYNCSDIVFYSLNLTKAKAHKNIWNTPVDTILIADEEKLIKSINLIPNDEYLIQMLEKKISFKEKKVIKKCIYGKCNFIDLTSNVSYIALNSYANIMFKNNKLEQNKYNILKLQIADNLKSTHSTIDISQYKSPLNLSKERSFSLGFLKKGNTNFTKISFLPASHLLSDNNLDYSGESELKLFYLSLLVGQKRVLLDEFSIYSIYSLPPNTDLLNLWSYRFSLSVKNIKQETFIVDGGVGKNFKWTDINLFILANTGVWYDKSDKAYIVAYPEIGILVYEALKMKSYIYYKHIFTTKQDSYSIAGIKQSFQYKKNGKLFLNLSRIAGENRIEGGFEIKF